MTLVTQDRIKVTVKSPAGVTPTLDGPWARSSGGGGERDVSRHREEAGGRRVALTGPLELTDITTERLFDAERDAPILEALLSGQKYVGTTITLTYLDESGAAIQTQNTYANCLVKDFTPPEADADGSDPGMLQIVWACA